MDIKLNYTENGSGEPLILLHGNGESQTYFRNQAELARHFRVIAVDTRGHGASPRGDAPFTIRQFALDLKRFMENHAIERAHILGFSDGGNIALCFALKYPDFVGKLILNGANLYPRGVKLSCQLPVTLRYRAAVMTGSEKKAEMLGLMVNDPNIKEEELANLAMPVLVIAGTKDMIRDRHTRLIASCIPNAELKIIEGNHFIAENNSVMFNKAILEFLLK